MVKEHGDCLFSRGCVSSQRRPTVDHRTIHIFLVLSVASDQVHRQSRGRRFVPCFIDRAPIPVGGAGAEVAGAAGRRQAGVHLPAGLD